MSLVSHHPAPPRAICTLAVFASACGMSMAPGPLTTVTQAQPGPTAPNDVVTIERGGFSNLSAVAAAAPDDVWAVGYDGIAHYDGASWRLIDAPPGLWGTDVAVGPDGIGWAVSERGDVVELRSGRATATALPWPPELWEVATTPSGAVWVAGEVVAVREAGTWRRLDVPIDGTVTALWMRTDQDGWAAVGDQLMRWDGAAWSAEATPAFRGAIHAIHGSAADDVWAVGGVTGILGRPSVRTMLHFDGAAWSVALDADDGGLHDVVMRAADDGWAAGQYGLMHYDGSQWSPDPDAPWNGWSRFGISGLAVADGGRLWIAGSGLLAERLLGVWGRWGGTRTEVTGSQALRLALAPSGVGWAVGYGGPVVWRHSDGRWRAESGPQDAELLDVVAAVSDVEAWAAVNATYAQARAMRLQSGQWTAYDLPTTEPVRRFSVVAPDAVWAIAPSQHRDRPQETAILRFDGAAWQLVATVPGALNALDMVSDRDGWAVGDVVYHFDGARWEPVSLQGAMPGAFTGVDVDASGHGWIVGSAGAYERIGGRWIDRKASLSVLGRGRSLTSIHIAPDGSAWGEVIEDSIGGTVQLVHRVAGVWKVVPLNPIADIFAHGGSDLASTGMPDRYDIWIGTHLETIARVTHTGETEASPVGHLVFLPIAGAT